MKAKKYVALLRGINVGGNNKVSMKKLKEVFEGLGFDNVSTYINSGNIIFHTNIATNLAKKIDTAIEKEFKIQVKVLVKEFKEIKSICNKIPASWTNDTEQRTDVIYLWKDFDKKSSLKLITVNPDVDNLIYTKGAIIWNMKRSNYTKSKMNKFIGTELYKNSTARNVNTARKLFSLLSV